MLIFKKNASTLISVARASANWADCCSSPPKQKKVTPFPKRNKKKKKNSCHREPWRATSHYLLRHCPHTIKKCGGSLYRGGHTLIKLILKNNFWWGDVGIPSVRTSLPRHPQVSTCHCNRNTFYHRHYHCCDDKKAYCHFCGDPPGLYSGGGRFPHFLYR